MFQVNRDAEAELWLDDIQETVKEANQESQKALKREWEWACRPKGSLRLAHHINRSIEQVFVCLVCLAVAAVNQAVKEKKISQTLRVLALPEMQLRGIISACAADYQRELYSLISARIPTGAHTHTHTHTCTVRHHLPVCWKQSFPEAEG